jgi:hypothetical protein
MAFREPAKLIGNSRFRAVSSFGKSTIRPIWYNVSEFHQLAARDYEDLLQVASPFKQHRYSRG